jgi:hypothetical protein
MRPSDCLQQRLCLSKACNFVTSDQGFDQAQIRRFCRNDLVCGAAARGELVGADDQHGPTWQLAAAGCGVAGADNLCTPRAAARQLASVGYGPLAALGGCSSTFLQLPHSIPPHLLTHSFPTLPPARDDHGTHDPLSGPTPHTGLHTASPTPGKPLSGHSQ